MPNTTKANSLKCILIEPNIPDRNFCEGEIRLNRSYLTAAVRFFCCSCVVLNQTKRNSFFLSVVFFVTFVLASPMSFHAERLFKCVVCLNRVEDYKVYE